MERLRILELESSNGWGGQEKRTVRLNNALSDWYDIHYAVSKQSQLYAKRLDIHGTFHPVAIRKSYDLAALYSIVKLVRRLRIDLIATHSGKDGWVGALAGKITGCPVIRTRHLQTPISSPLSYNLSTRVVTVSQLVAKDLEQRGVKSEKLITIHTGIDCSRFSPESGRTYLNEVVPELQPDETVIGIVAVMREAKRHVDLVPSRA